MIIDGKRYLYPNLNNKKYLIKICKSIEDNEAMVSYLDKIVNDVVVSIDFEFNRSIDNTHREIALMQMNLDLEEDRNHIYLFYPPILNKNQLSKLKNFFFRKNIKKVIHGGESLDIPYLFKNIFVNTNEQLLFINNLYDTKYLCEYYNISNNKIDFKCKIYYLLKQMNVITNEQMEFLLKNEELMGPIYNIRIDINNLKKELILYSAFDVLFLNNLLQKFPKQNIYLNLIPNIVNIHFILKQTTFFSEYNELLNQFNINYIIYKGNKKVLVNIFKEILKKIESNLLILNNLSNINYIKKFFTNITKNIVYLNILKRYTIYVKTDIINIKELYAYSFYINKYINIKYFNSLSVFLVELNDFTNNLLNNIYI
uniref:3'-5' exonuclease domain-containing protein n=1 Tax=Megaviridae environmental sample TaxID=1737588 RepID=A0A5J6VL28_9VIRU|nr:MAG: hypothetical protein [Megaviridae environmental sample]